jgi:Family of unknown function (DUF5999)
MASHPEQGWSLLCNGIVAFDDTGALLPNGRSIPPRTSRPTEGDRPFARRPRPVTARAAAAMRRGGRITAEQVLLRLLDQQAADPAAALLAALRVDRAAVQGRLGAAPTALAG